ncbi:MAG: hypothetical protein Q7V05_14055 [Methanoregula sp.]|nr:hypothetical protein [Methanoregula sp.]
MVLATVTVPVSGLQNEGNFCQVFVEVSSVMVASLPPAAHAGWYPFFLIGTMDKRPAGGEVKFQRTRGACRLQKILWITSFLISSQRQHKWHNGD